MVFVQSSNSKAEVPPGAVLLTEREAVEYRYAAMEGIDWRETWPLVYGRKILAISLAAQSAYILMRFRRKLKLGNYGLTALTLPFAGAPVIFSAYLQEQYVVRPIILENECSICLHTRLVAMNTFLVSGFSALGGAVASLYYAHHVGTYTLPPRKWENILVFGQHCLKLNKPLIGYHWLFLAFNILSSCAMIALQQHTLQKVNHILEEEEIKLAHKLYLREKQRRYNV